MANVNYKEIVEHLKKQGLTYKEIEYLTDNWDYLSSKSNNCVYDTEDYHIKNIVPLEDWYDDIKSQFETLPFPYCDIGKYFIENFALADADDTFIKEYSEYVESLDDGCIYMTYMPCSRRVVLWEKL